MSRDKKQDEKFFGNMSFFYKYKVLNLFQRIQLLKDKSNAKC